MKFSSSQPDLLARLQVISRAASTRSAVPALGGILLEVADGHVRLAATDLEIGLEVSLPAQSEGSGKVVLPARLFLDVVRTLSGDTVSLELRETERDIELTAGPSRFHLRTLSGDDFPQLPQPSAEEIKMAAAPLVETIERVARAASRDDARPILTGVLVRVEGRRLTMVATDSYRLSVKHTELEGELPQPLEANIPARALRELSRLATADGVQEVGVSLLANQAVFRAGDVVLSSRLIDGQFPNYRQLLPESFEHEVRLPRGRAARGRHARQPAGPAQRAAAAGVQRGRADGGRRDPRCRRRERDDARALPGRASRSASTPSSSRTASRRWTRRRSC